MPGVDLVSDDGLPVREAGAWTNEKLDYVKRYAGAFVTAMRGKWPSLAYIDLLCGPGRCAIREQSKRHILGSPLLALNIKPPFDAFHFSDSSDAFIDALRQRLPVERASATSLRVGDCNAIVTEVVQTLPRGTLALAFLDPEGFEVHFKTLAMLATRPIDILYLFPSGIGIKRNVKQFLQSSPDTMDRFWGGPDWRDCLAKRAPAGSGESADEATARSWVEAFARKLRSDLGLFCQEIAPLITNDRNARMYHLLFLSKHNTGLKLWEKVTKIDPHGQRRLPWG